MNFADVEDQGFMPLYKVEDQGFMPLYKRKTIQNRSKGKE